MKTKYPEILNNPAFQLAAAARDIKTGALEQIADAIISTKVWGDMCKKERDICVNYMASQSESEQDLRQRLIDIGAKYFAINWQDINPNDQRSLEAQMIVKALGGPIAKNGALVAVHTIDDF